MPPPEPDQQVVDFPTLGFLIADWGEAHCVIPDGFRKGEPFVLYREQLWFLVNHYRVRPGAQLGQLAPAFHFRRSQLVRPQKWGKGPLIAFQVCAEAVGPVLFAGWAVGGEKYDCRSYGCGCGFVYVYEPGEPMGMPWPTPLVQITAYSEDQTGNIYDALRPMIDKGPLHELIPKTGEELIRLPHDGEISVVTSNAQSRLGQRVTFVPQDETGIWVPSNGMVKVAETQRRGLAGMGGRAVETTNSWDPAENSVAQRTYESKVQDIYHDFRQPPAGLKYGVKAQRRAIHLSVYGDSLVERGGHVDLDAIEAEAAEILELDPAQAERFFGNRISVAQDAWIDPRVWREMAGDARLEPGDEIALGFDGSRFDDSTALVAVRVRDGFTSLIACWEKPEGPVGDGWEVPRGAVDTVVRATFRRYKVLRFNGDPPYWEDPIAAWHADFGDVVREFWTSQAMAMGKAIVAAETAIRGRDFRHDGSAVLERHVANARRRVDRGWPVLRKERKGSPRKIDASVAWVLAWQARLQALGVTDAAPEQDYAFAAW